MTAVCFLATWSWFDSTKMARLPMPHLKDEVLPNPVAGGNALRRHADCGVTVLSEDRSGSNLSQSSEATTLACTPVAGAPVVPRRSIGQNQ
jgi:hypothetical protein